MRSPGEQICRMACRSPRLRVVCVLRLEGAARRADATLALKKLMAALPALDRGTGGPACGECDADRTRPDWPAWVSAGQSRHR